MTRWKLILLATLVYAISLGILYLTWVGAQHLCFHSVTMEATDIIVAGILAAFITREIVLTVNTVYVFKHRKEK